MNDIFLSFGAICFIVLLAIPVILHKILDTEIDKEKLAIGIVSVLTTIFLLVMASILIKI